MVITKKCYWFIKYIMIILFDFFSRLISARAQLLHQQALIQQQKNWTLDSQQKLCQLLQLAHFQAYLANMVSRSTKSE